MFYSSKITIVGVALLLSCVRLPVCSAAAEVTGGAIADSVVVDGATETTIKGALKWLAAAQESSGGWSVSPDGRGKSAVAMTGYTLMAFMAAGNLPDEGEYSKNVTAGMQFLLDQIGPDGLYRDPKGHDYMYSHGIATIALAELYGQTRSPAIRTKLERVIKVIIGAQNKEGGWRYDPSPREADLSVTVLQVVAARAAKNAGIEVPQKTIDDAVRYVRSCYDASKGVFCYQPGKKPGFSRTAAAIYSLQVCGLYDDPMVDKGSQYLLKSKDDGEYYSYGHYYAAPAHYMIGGTTWQTWYAREKALILGDAKNKDGMIYWEPTRDKGGVGPVFTTAVNTVILSLPYHYLPLYQR